MPQASALVAASATAVAFAAAYTLYRRLSRAGEEPFPLLPISSPDTISNCHKLPLREGDVFIASYPKSGTTWMQHVVHTLATDGCSPLPHISDACPFFEVDRTWEAGELSAAVQANHRKIGRRIFNTHLRWPMMPKSHPGARYVYMTRRGTDAAVSFYHHLAHQAPEDGQYQGTLAAFLSEWASGTMYFGSWSAHLKSWLGTSGHADDPRVLVIAYEEMKVDLLGCVAKVNEHCGFGLSTKRLAELLPRFEFEWMRQHEAQFNPRSVRWVRLPGERDSDAFHFIRAGRVGDGNEPFASPELQGQLRAMVGRTFGMAFGASDAPPYVAKLLPA